MTTITPTLLTTQEAARYLGISVPTLERMRMRRVGPRPVRYPGARKVLYRQSELERYIDAATESYETGFLAVLGLGSFGALNDCHAG